LIKTPVTNVDDEIIANDLAFIESDTKINDIVSDDLFLTAWNLNERTPRFFNQWSAANEQGAVYGTTNTSKRFDHDYKLGEMTWMSANTPYYFQPAVVDNEVFISGDNIAKSPSLFAYMYATQRKVEKGEDIRVVTIGSTNELPDYVDGHMSLVDWVARLTTLTQ
jgi:hypothetical protein